MKLYFFSILFLILILPISSFSQKKQQHSLKLVTQGYSLSTDVVLDSIRPVVIKAFVDADVEQDSIKLLVPLDVKFTPVVEYTSPPKLKMAVGKKMEIPFITTSHWVNKNTIGFDLNEIAFLNWNAGGTSSISGLFKGNITARRSDLNSEWHNELIFKYGVNKQDGLAMRKSDDEFQFNSTFGYREDTLSNWYFSTKFNFKTQFSNGYKYPDKTPISKPFAPAYTFLGTGADYFDKEKKFDVYISPLTLKNTLVLDQDLADKGAFGMTKATYDTDGNRVTPGENARTEVGILVTNYYKKEVWKNITMENRLSLYSDYINNFGNVDVDWKLQLDLIVNQYVRANIGTHLIYDDDVKNRDTVNGVVVVSGAKVQLKQSLGIGMVYNF